MKKFSGLSFENLSLIEPNSQESHSQSHTEWSIQPMNNGFCVSPLLILKNINFYNWHRDIQVITIFYIEHTVEWKWPKWIKTQPEGVTIRVNPIQTRSATNIYIRAYATRCNTLNSYFISACIPVFCNTSTMWL